MKMSRGAGMARSRFAVVLATVACLVALPVLAGCSPPPPAGTAEETKRGLLAAWLSKDDPELAGTVFGGPANKDAPDGTVMKSEDDAVRLEGKWTWPSLKIDYTESLQDPRIYPIERVGEGWTFTIIKKGNGYTTISGGTVTQKGTSVTITEESSDGDSITLTGEVRGDTIVGTVHQSITAKTLSSGVAQGAGEYDGPWTTTRVK